MIKTPYSCTRSGMLVAVLLTFSVITLFPASSSTSAPKEPKHSVGEYQAAFFRWYTQNIALSSPTPPPYSPRTWHATLPSSALGNLNTDEHSQPAKPLEITKQEEDHEEGSLTSSALLGPDKSKRNRPPQESVNLNKHKRSRTSRDASDSAEVEAKVEAALDTPKIDLYIRDILKKNIKEDPTMISKDGLLDHRWLARDDAPADTIEVIDESTIIPLRDMPLVIRKDDYIAWSMDIPWEKWSTIKSMLHTKASTRVGQEKKQEEQKGKDLAEKNEREANIQNVHRYLESIRLAQEQEIKNRVSKKNTKKQNGEIPFSVVYIPVASHNQSPVDRPVIFFSCCAVKNGACKYKSNQKSCVKAHMKNVHPENPHVYKCTVLRCTASFKKQMHLTLHKNRDH